MSIPNITIEDDQIIQQYSNCSELSPNGLYYLSISNALLIVYPLFLILFGTVANITSIIVLTRPKLRKLSTFFYLACLSAIDLTVLYTFCINFISYYFFNVDLQSKHVILCKLFAFFIYFLPQFSAWTCVAVSFDRVISVIFAVGNYSLIAKKWNTPNRARTIMVIIGVCLFCLNAQFLFYPNEYQHPVNHTVEDINLIYCSPENIPRFQSYYNNIWVYVDLSINVLVPFAIMIVCSFIIILRVQKSAHKLNKNTQKSQIVKKSVGSVSYSSISMNTAKNSSKDISRKKSTAVHHSANSKARNISLMLAANNFIFISLTLPIVVFLSIAPPFSDDTICADKKAVIRLVKVICIILMNTNCTVNIFIYSLMSSEFKKHLNSLFCNVCRLDADGCEGTTTQQRHHHNRPFSTNNRTSNINMNSGIVRENSSQIF